MFKSVDRIHVILILVIGLLVLASFVALGHVEEKTSYGLEGIIALLALITKDLISGLPHRAKDEPKDPPIA